MVTFNSVRHVIWKTITLSLKSKGRNQNQVALPEALHSIRSLLCTAINCTPHERIFIYPRRSSNGTALPAWLLQPGPVLVKRNERMSTYEPLVDEAELTMPLQHANGREATVSLKQLAPRCDINLTSELDNIDSDQQIPITDSNYHISTDQSDSRSTEATSDTQEDKELKTCSRTRKVPEYLKDYVF